MPDAARNRTRVKICGITRPEDARTAAQLGCDAIGLVFWPRSSRAVTVDAARAVCSALPPFVTTVGLFVDAEPAAVRAVLDRVPLDLLQFHGDESPQACRRHGRPYVKAVRMRPGTDLGAVTRDYADAAGLLVDAYRKGVPGGTGSTFDWALLPAAPEFPLVLAGGLEPGNVAAAVRRVRPWAVDVSGGVEAAPGIKDAALIAAFMQGVRDADGEPRAAPAAG
ncbi:MAG TPA: phosphoribosylanthranilate isomerase [Gammaproteobacteria bacterium]